ncbi:MAG: glucosaminidase domain-containing protein [Dysgonamonadaceae bacterium]|jgi:LysM repeat protein|nr:glucosaminidase domain-containing protein [Dysgonamonadaceae bacterium]
MKMFRQLMIVSSLFCTLAIPSNAQKQSAYINYINKHKLLAIKEMKEHGVPASITLAQGLLESFAGQSELARTANNHFGIKCASDWKGGKVYYDDDRANECFRRYKKTEDSYRDHSLFLTGRPRYAGLFALKNNDYKGWAKGLQRSGYATDNAYANKLIKIIELYELHRYDRKKSYKLAAKYAVKRPTYISRKLLYVEAKSGDSYKDIAADMGVSLRKLLKYNETPKDFPLKKGDIVYLQSKRKRADSPAVYTVKTGDSMHRISQCFGIRMGNLYKINLKNRDYVPTEGDILRLR